jgi:hypothetical protein
LEATDAASDLSGKFGFSTNDSLKIQKNINLKIKVLKLTFLEECQQSRAKHSRPSC